MKAALDSVTVDEASEAEIVPPQFVIFPSSEPPTALKQIIDVWGLIEHREGGYFKETDRSPFTMSVSSAPNAGSDQKQSAVSENGKDVMVPESTTVKRNYSTLIYYLLTPNSPVGKLHKNKNRIIHILQRGKGQYVLIYPDGRIKSFKVGFDYLNGEVSQWVVPGGVYKASFLIPNEEFSNGLLISEVVVPGFEYDDHNFLSGSRELLDLVGAENAERLKFLL